MPPLADAAAEAGVRRFVLTSILTCDKTPGVPHFCVSMQEVAVARLLTSLGHPVAA